MIAVSWIQFLVGAAFLIAGLVFYVIQFIGVFRFKYVMNRMHAAAIGDTLGSSLMMLGAVILNGLQLSTLKMVVIIAALWITAPVSSHMLAKLEVMSKEKMEDVCPVVTPQELAEEKEEQA